MGVSKPYTHTGKCFTCGEMRVYVEHLGWVCRYCLPPEDQVAPATPSAGETGPKCPPGPPAPASDGPGEEGWRRAIGDDHRNPDVETKEGPFPGTVYARTRPVLVCDECGQPTDTGRCANCGHLGASIREVPAVDDVGTDTGVPAQPAGGLEPNATARPPSSVPNGETGSEDIYRFVCSACGHVGERGPSHWKPGSNEVCGYLALDVTAQVDEWFKQSAPSAESTDWQDIAAHLHRQLKWHASCDSGCTCSDGLALKRYEEAARDSQGCAHTRRQHDPEGANAWRCLDCGEWFCADDDKAGLADD